MKLMYKGEVSTKVTGCRSCGSRRKSKKGFVPIQTFYLPSGQEKTFRVGRAEEVSDTDGSFLLQFKDEKGESIFKVM